MFPRLCAEYNVPLQCVKRGAANDLNHAVPEFEVLGGRLPDPGKHLEI